MCLQWRMLSTWSWAVRHCRPATSRLTYLGQVMSIKLQDVELKPCDLQTIWNLICPDAVGSSERVSHQDLSVRLRNTVSQHPPPPLHAGKQCTTGSLKSSIQVQDQVAVKVLGHVVVQVLGWVRTFLSGGHTSQTMWVPSGSLPCLVPCSMWPEVRKTINATWKSGLFHRIVFPWEEGFFLLGILSSQTSSNTVDPDFWIWAWLDWSPS